MYDYKRLYEKHARFYRAHKKAEKCLIFSNTFLTWLFVSAYAGLLLFIALRFRAWEHFLKVLIPPVGCFLLVYPLRLLFNRKRPYHKEGAGITPFVKKETQHSFPSRHLACALAIATVFLPYSLWAGVCLSVLSIGMAYVRFALGLHYPSDLFAGALLGSLCGLPIFFI